MNDEELRTRYQTDGFVFPVDVLSPSEAADYRERLETIEQQFRPTLPVDRYLKFDPHYLLPLIDELVRLPRLLDLAATFLGPDLLVSNTNIFLKEPNRPDHVTWHQDMRYIGLDGDDFLTVWLAFSPATEEKRLHAVPARLSSRKDGASRYLRRKQHADPWTVDR